MDSSLILSNVLNPPVLFFFIGLIAVFTKSDLEIPQPIPKLFSLYLLFAIGFKGGHELHESGLTTEVAGCPNRRRAGSGHRPDLFVFYSAAEVRSVQFGCDRGHIRLY